MVVEAALDDPPEPLAVLLELLGGLGVSTPGRLLEARRLVVVGGSYIGREFGQAYRPFGANVTIVEKAPRLVAREDEDVSEAIRGLELEGIAVRTSAECIRFAPHGDGIAVGVDCRVNEPSVVGSHVLLAMGRRPNTDDLGLDAAGSRPTPAATSSWTTSFAPTCPASGALGDCYGRGAFTHTALQRLRDHGRDRVPAYVLYIDPPLGRTGMTETEARASGRPAAPRQHATP